MVFSGRIIRSGNYVSDIAHYLNQGLEVFPGIIAAQYVGRAIITAAATSWDIQDRGGLAPVLPVGARVYRLSLRLPTGLTGTNGHRLKVADAVATAANRTNILSDAVSGGNFPASVTYKLTNPWDATGEIAGTPMTLRLFSVDGTGTAAGGSVTGSSEGGNPQKGIQPETPVIVEVCYTMPRVAPTNDDYRVRNATSLVQFP